MKDQRIHVTRCFADQLLRRGHDAAPCTPGTALGCRPPSDRSTGVTTVACCTDGTVMGGAMGVVGCAHIVDAIDTAIAEQAPVVGIWHSGGARLAEGVEALRTPSA